MYDLWPAGRYLSSRTIPSKMAIDSSVARIIVLAGQIRKLETFEPSATVNALFGELVGLVLALNQPWAVIEPMLAGSCVQQLVLDCSAAESALEFHWAFRIAQGEPVTSFVYFRTRPARSR